jgi:predicted nucleic-acid-binding Zn-ribbon protein
MISKKNIKSKKNLKKSKTQKGGLFNKKKPAVYTNIIYPKSNTGFMQPELNCSICKKNQFKMRTMQIGTRAKDFLFNTDVFDNSFKVFTCVSCGKVMFYSNKIQFNENKMHDTSSKSRK